MFLVKNVYIALIHITKVRCKLLCKGKSRISDPVLKCLSKEENFKSSIVKLNS